MSRLLASITVFTVHSNTFDLDNLFNRISLRLTDGVIVLNEELAQLVGPALQARSIQWIMLPPIFAEGVAERAVKSLPFIKIIGIRYCLAYAYRRRIIDGQDVYGVDFLLANLDRLQQDCMLVLLDPSGSYREDVALLNNRIIYIDRPVADMRGLFEAVDVYVRPTITDGSSVAVLEALLCGTPVVASDAVPRPDGVTTYRTHDLEDFLEMLRVALHARTDPRALPSVDEYLSFVGSLHSIV